VFSNNNNDIKKGLDSYNCISIQVAIYSYKHARYAYIAIAFYIIIGILYRLEPNMLA